jgi:hypothetical protein
VLVAIGAIVAAALIVGNSQDDEPGGAHHRAHRHHTKQHGGPDKGGHTAPLGVNGPVTVSLVARQDIRVCLVRNAGEAVIDAQALDVGSTSGPFQPAERYRLDLESGGSVDLRVNGRRQIARAPHQASFVITAAGVRAIPFAGPRCP